MSNTCFPIMDTIAPVSSSMRAKSYSTVIGLAVEVSDSANRENSSGGSEESASTSSSDGLCHVR